MKYLYLFITLILLSSCLKEEPLNRPFLSIEPKNINDGHILSTPTAENIDSLGLIEIFEDVYDDEDLWSLRSLLVFRNGHLVAESYLKNGHDIITKHMIWSCTKQVIGVLVGIAIDKGLIENIDDPISKYLEEELVNHPDKQDITIRNLLTMQSGINYNNDGNKGQTDKILREIPNDIVKFILKRPMNASPGEEFHYNDGNPHLLSAIIQKITGKPTDVWADEVLFSTIELDNYNWVRYKDGLALGGNGLETTPRELAKIALCAADSGKWKNQQVIPSDWINEMLTLQVDTEYDYDFGYLWWLDESRNIQFMWGHGGQFVFIVPSKNLVVVMTSFPNTQGDYQIHADEALPIVDNIIAISN